MSFPRLPALGGQPRDVSRAINALLANPLAGATLIDAVDDAAAATAGVKVGQVYRNGSVIMVRVA